MFWTKGVEENGPYSALFTWLLAILKKIRFLISVGLFSWYFVSEALAHASHLLYATYQSITN
jgi:hypothetical protein